MEDESYKHFKKHLEQFVQFDGGLNLSTLEGDDVRSKKNPTIPIANFRQQLRNMRGSLNLTDRQIEVLTEAADENRDGEISLEEFRRLITSRDAQESPLKRILYSIADPMITPNQAITVHSNVNESPWCPPPLFIVGISLLQALVFFAYLFMEADPTCDVYTCCPGCSSDPSSFGSGLWYFNPDKRIQIWRYITYSFMHSGLSHLLGNISAQIVVGLPLEIVHRSSRIAAVYFIAVVGGCMLQYALNPGVKLVGASSGVYAMITAHLANVFLNWSEMPRKWLRLILTAGYVINDFSSEYAKLRMCKYERVSVAGHFGGAIVGLFMGVFVLYNIKIKRHEVILRYVCLSIACLFLFALLIANIVRTPESSAIFPALFHCDNDDYQDDEEVLENDESS